MEESEKRRERLKAMREEASHAGTHGEAENSMGMNFGHGLGNPLIESQTSQPGIAEPYSRPRFDFYTDPMAAFSADKRKSKHSPQVSQPYSTPPRPGYSDPPAYHAQGSYFVDQRPQAHGVHHTFSPRVTPMQNNLSGTLPENPPNVWGSPDGIHASNFPPNYPRFSNFANHRYGRGSPGFDYGRGSPRFDDGRGIPRFDHGRGSPGFDYGRGSPGFDYGRGSPGFDYGRGSPGFDYGRGSPGFDSGQGRGQIFSNSPRPYSGHGRSPYQDSGRGRGGRWQGNNNVSSSSMRGGRRGSGNRESFSAEARPDLYYNKSMIEDPWEQLPPTIWKKVYTPSIDTPDSQKPWLPNSIRMKKARVSEGQVKSSPQQSLAEYLAASFNEAVDEGVNGEPSA